MQVGEISIDELEGIDRYSGFTQAGGREYDPEKDRGDSMSFWDGKLDPERCAWRVNQARYLFQRHYPDQPWDLPAPGECNES